MSVRTITLKLLREGPTHNHLLSPLTPYLAVVGQYEAVSLRVPYEHRRMLRDLNALRYGATATRLADVSRINAPDRRLIADDVSAILAAVPGLTAEMSPQHVCHPQLTHLCLEFSAAELSLVPFEIATAPKGFPGEGTPLSVQTLAPLVVTRCIPAAPGRRCRWGGKPRVLFVAAQPPGFPDIPLKAHLVALVRALQPWSGPVADDPESAEEYAAALAPWLTVLPRATLADIESACRSARYTHVHILAHSEMIEEASQSQFALALHDRDGGKELVSAERLQAALRIALTTPVGDVYLSHPLVVSLATCDSGNLSQVVFPAMSLAHALHVAGVPLVVGSLFPLSTRGSAVLVDTLYTGLLRGRDPRWVLHDVRHDLFRAAEDTHDWASMVAYTAFSDRFDEQIHDLAYEACRAAIKSAIAGGQRTLRVFASPRKPGDSTSTTLAAALNNTVQQVETSAKTMPLTEAYSVEGNGMLASADKNLAELFFRAATMAGSATVGDDPLLERSRALLTRARDRYREASQLPRWPTRPRGETPTLHWVLTQSLSLTAVLDETLDWEAWWAAKSDAGHFIRPRPAQSGDLDDETWAHGSLAELYLLAHAAAARQDTPAAAPTFRGDARGQSQRHLLHLVERARVTSSPTIYLDSTEAQLKRYVDWWCTAAFSREPGPVRRALGELAQQLLDALKAAR